MSIKTKAMAAEVTPEQQNLVSALLSSGNYATEKAVLDEALDLLHQRDRLRSMLQTGIDELDAGQRVSASDTFQRLRTSVPAAE